MNIKRPLLFGAALATVTLGGLGGVGVASAATDKMADSNNSIIEKIANKFNLNKDEVKAVFDDDRAAHKAEMEAKHKERLAAAVKDGRLTQEQADHITAVQAEIKTLRGDAGPDAQDSTLRDQIRSKMDGLRDWAEDNDVDMHYIMGGHKGHGSTQKQ